MDKENKTTEQIEIKETENFEIKRNKTKKKKINRYRKIESYNNVLKTTESFVGQSLEEKVYQAVNSKAPIEAVAPMVYTERKDGVVPETNIRTDRFEIAQEAMTNIANGIREKRAKKLLEGNKTTDKPVTDSGNKTTTGVQE